MERRPGRGRYAATEREQRWLLRQLPTEVTDPVEITDTQLDGSPLSKTRWQWAVGEHRLSVDQFGGHLQSLIVAEVELPVGAGALPDPPFAVAEVTEDDRFSGGHLAQLTPSAAQDFLRQIAEMISPAEER